MRYYIPSLTTIALFEKNIGYRSWRVTIGAQTKGAPYYRAPAEYDRLIRNSTHGARQGCPFRLVALSEAIYFEAYLGLSSTSRLNIFFGRLLIIFYFEVLRFCLT